MRWDWSKHALGSVCGHSIEILATSTRSLIQCRSVLPFLRFLLRIGWPRGGRRHGELSHVVTHERRDVDPGHHSLTMSASIHPHFDLQANSTWTGNHMRELWGKFQTVQVAMAVA